MRHTKTGAKTGAKTKTEPQKMGARERAAMAPANEHPKIKKRRPFYWGTYMLVGCLAPRVMRQADSSRQAMQKANFKLWSSGRNI